MANEGIAHQGVIPVGEGFRIEASEAVQISREDQRSTEVIKPYKIGRDLLQRDQGMYIIDLYGHDWSSVVTEHPRVAQIVLNRVKPQRDANRRPRRRERFWLYADSCEEMRNGLSGLERYIATCRTAKHRVFSFLEGNVLPDAKIVAITDSSSQMLSLLSSRIHVLFSISHGGWQGAGNDPVYQHSDTFNPFPFSPSKKVEAKLSKLGERLDSFRKERLAIHNFLTMTGLYNALERLREIENSCDVEPLSPTERDVHNAGLISVLKEIHDDIDRTVLNVYGWDDLAPAIIGKPGGLVPSEHKSEEQLVAEEELLRRLTTLNYERAEEEKKGNIRWLRPDYQVPKLGLKAIKFKTEELDLEVVETVSKPKWPGDGLAQIRLVRDVLAKAAAPASPIAISAAFDGRNTSARKDRVAKVLETMVVTGAARAASEGAEPRYFIIR